MKPHETAGAARNRSRITTVLVALLMLAGVLAVYAPWPVIIGEEIVTGADHVQLHARRMTFARENLFGPDRHLPAWYPRELMGTPFRANLQNFPWIPTRLILLWGVEPDSALGTGAALSAALAALFTMLFCLRLGIGRVASAASGWTFACSGFYASRVLAGHLPLLEAYPALPALLWLTDRVLTSGQPRMWKIDRALIVLAVAAMCFALAGHPQLTVYGLTVPTPAGNHELRLVYRTPGATTGAMISIASAVLLVMFALAVPRMKRGKSRSRDGDAS